MIRRYRVADGIVGYSAGDVLIPDTGPRARVVATGAGVQLDPIPAEQGSACDRCGDYVSDLDAGFSPGLHEMRCSCGGTWVDIGAEVEAGEGGAR